METIISERQMTKSAGEKKWVCRALALLALGYFW